MGVRRIIKPFLLILLVAAYTFSFLQLKQLRTDMPKATKRAQALNVDPTLLRVVSGPFSGLLADYLLLKASVFVGGAWETLPEDWETVYTLFKQSLFLDPYFFQTGYYAQGLLSWRKGMHDKAVELLKYQVQYRDWDWEPFFYLGFDYFYYLKDNDEAAKYMQQSALLPGAPPITATLGARLAQRTGQTLTAIALLRTMYENAEDEQIKAIYADRLTAYIGVNELEQAISRFESVVGRRPHTLEEIVTAGIISALPKNPFGDHHFIYEPDSGKVFFDEQH